MRTRTGMLWAQRRRTCVDVTRSSAADKISVRNCCSVDGGDVTHEELVAPPELTAPGAVLVFETLLDVGASQPAAGVVSKRRRAAPCVGTPRGEKASNLRGTTQAPIAIC
eukprot:364163-Chlamydomonas_euryale.AAC.12